MQSVAVPDVHNRSVFTPIERAALNNNFKMARLLVQLKADVNSLGCYDRPIHASRLRASVDFAADAFWQTVEYASKTTRHKK